MDTDIVATITEARNTISQALATLDKEITERKKSLSELENLRASLDNTTPLPTDPPLFVAPRSRPKKPTEERAFETLAKVFTLEDLRQTGISPVAIAHWTRARKIRRLRNGTYRKL